MLKREIINPLFPASFKLNGKTFYQVTDNWGYIMCDGCEKDLRSIKPPEGATFKYRDENKLIILVVDVCSLECLEFFKLKYV